MSSRNNEISATTDVPMCDHRTFDTIRSDNLPSTPTKEVVHIFACVCLFVRLSVSKINTQKRVHGFG